MDGGEEIIAGKDCKSRFGLEQLLEDLVKTEFEKAHCEDSKKQYNLCQMAPAPTVQLTNEVKVTYH
jgi:hypothetical protein